MSNKPFDRVWGWATVVFAIAAIGLLVGLGFKLMLFVFPVTWKFWHGLCALLYYLGIWAFRIGTPTFVILCVVAFIGNLIYSIAHKD